MSASPQTTSTKRPLEETSSPSRNDQPDAKRPALDKIIKGDDEVKELISESNGDAVSSLATAEVEANGTMKTNGDKTDVKDAQGDTVVPDAPEGKALVGTIASHTVDTRAKPPANSHDETAWLHIRAAIANTEAATIIGKGGENVTKIRQLSGAKCTLSEYKKGVPERILTISGIVDAVAKAFGLIIRTLNNEPLAETSDAHSKTYPMRLLVPHVLIGSIIGKSGSRIKEIQEASGARLNASDSCLPLSSERSLVVMGVADAVHIATYYVCSTLLEQYNERFGGPSSSAYATRGGGPAGVVPGGLQVVPYDPQPTGGNFGSREHYNNNYHRGPGPRGPAYPPAPYGQQPYGQPHPQAHQPTPMHYGGQPAAGYGPAPHMQPHPAVHGGPQPPHVGPHGQPVQGGPAMGVGALTQQIYIPNDMVGAIIGKGGAKINEIRQVSGSVIKINEPQDNSNERLVTITGTEECNRMALYMLYSRLESEKHRV